MTNYRSHGGIVNCARSVIELIELFWPDTIDSLRPESGVVDGLRPIFLGGWDQDSVRYEQFLFGASWVLCLNLAIQVIDTPTW